MPQCCNTAKHTSYIQPLSVNGWEQPTLLKFFRSQQVQGDWYELTEEVIEDPKKGSREAHREEEYKRGVAGGK